MILLPQKINLCVQENKTENLHLMIVSFDNWAKLKTDMTL